DLQSDHGSRIVPLGYGPVIETDMKGKAFIAAPGIAKAKDLKRIEEGMGLLLPAAGQHDGENAGGAGKIPLPDFMSRMAFQSRMQNAVNRWVAFKPARDFQCVLAVLLQPHAHRAHAAQDLVGIVSRCAQSKRSVRFEKLRPAFLIGRYRTEQNVGM